jgi:hypothetical protein
MEDAPPAIRKTRVAIIETGQRPSPWHWYQEWTSGAGIEPFIAARLLSDPDQYSDWWSSVNLAVIITRIAPSVEITTINVNEYDTGRGQQQVAHVSPTISSIR